MKANISLTEIIPGDNDRSDFRHVPALATSIYTNGLLQAITVRKLEKPRPMALNLDLGKKTIKFNSDGIYQIIAGESRWRAHVFLGKDVIAAEIVDYDDKSASWGMLIENETRSDLNPVEQGNAYQKRLRGGATVAEIARRIGRSASYINDRLALLDLRSDYQHMVKYGQLTMGYAKAMAGLRREYQKPAIDWLVKNQGNVGLSGFKSKCAELREKQAQADQMGFVFGYAPTPPCEQVRVKRPLDPEKYTPNFSGINIKAAIAVEVDKLVAAKISWENSPFKDKDQKVAQCKVLITQLEAMLEAMVGLTTVNSVECKVMDKITLFGSATKTKLMQYCNIKKVELETILQRLIDNGKVTQIKSGRGYKYMVVGVL